MRNVMAICMLLGALAPAIGSAADVPAQKPAHLDAKVPISIDYLVYVPKDYDTKPAWPLMLFLHGAGERGSNLDLVKKHGPPKLIDEGKDFPMIVVSPQCPSDRWWTTEQLTLSALLDEIVSKYHVDRDRIYLTGLSMGGFGTWSLAAYTPDRFAAIVPICGGGEGLAARRLAKMPTWVFHGGKDAVVPLKRSEDMVAALKHSGNEAKFTIYPDAGHDSWTATYDNPELYTWLLAQSRKGATSP